MSYRPVFIFDGRVILGELPGPMKRYRSRVDALGVEHSEVTTDGGASWQLIKSKFPATQITPHHRITSEEL